MWSHLLRLEASLALGLAATLCGCAAAGDTGDLRGPNPMPARSDNETANQLPLGSREIRLLSEDRVRLGFSERSTILVQLVDREGTPLPDSLVSFALVGRSQDAGLTRADVVTNADGIAENMLTASAMSASFDVRITAAGAQEQRVAIGVSDAGFGTLRVQAPYVGARTALQRNVFAQANMDCKRAMPMSGDPVATIGPRESMAEFLVLPAGFQYAVLALAEGKDGVVVARGCVDGVRVNAEGVTLVWVKFENEPLEADGTFSIEAELDVSEPADVLGATLRNAAETLVLNDALGNALTSPEARLLLDALDSTLRSETLARDPAAIALADALAADRSTPLGLLSPQAELAGLLRANGVGALSTIQLMAKVTKADMQRLRLLARVGIESENGSDTLVLTFDAMRVEARAKDAMAPPPAAVDLTHLPAAETTAIRGEDDVLVFEGARFALPFGLLGSQVLRQAVSFGANGYGSDIRAQIGCDQLQEWLSWKLYAQEGCDSGCVQMACDRAVARLTSAAETALMAVDETRPTLTLAGELQLDDTDGDLFAEQLSSEALTGEWNPAEGENDGDVIEGAATPAMPVPNE